MTTSRLRSARPLRRLVGITGYAIFLLAAATLLLEAGVRLVLPQSDMPRWYRESARYGYVLKPGFRQRYRFAGADFVMNVRTNAAGLRDEPLEPEPEGGVSVLCIGDSFTFGYGVNVEDRFDTVLHRCLEEVLPARVINAGVPGWGTIQATQFARDHFDEFQPDVIVLTFCDNDPQDDARWLAGETVFREGGLVQFPGKRWLRNHSHLYRLLLERSKILRQRMAGGGKERPAPEGGAAGVGAGGETESVSSISEGEWERTLGVLREFHADFRAFNPDGILCVQATAPGDPGVARHLRHFAQADGVYYVDLGKAAAGYREDEILLPFDRHWSPLMHRQAGLALCRALSELLLSG